MKNYLLFALFSAFILTSCNKDPEPAELILGLWTLDSFVIDGEEGIATEVDGGTTYSTSGTIQFNEGGNVTLTLIEEESDGTMIIDSETTTEVGTYTLNEDGATLTMTFPSDDILITGSINVLDEATFDYSGTITADGEVTSTIIKATKQ